MGICSNNFILKNITFCNSPPIDNNVIIINLDKNETHDNSKNNVTKEMNSNNNNLENNNKIVIYKIKSKYKSKIKSSLNNISTKNDDLNNNESNKYKVTNDKIEKLIHFTNFNSVSVTTNSIIK
jgi:hypothetical protein